MKNVLITLGLALALSSVGCTSMGFRHCASCAKCAESAKHEAHTGCDGSDGCKMKHHDHAPEAQAPSQQGK